MSIIKKIILASFCLVTICFPMAVHSADLPLIKILATGGTIVAIWDAEKGGYVSSLKGDFLVKAVPEIQKLARIEVEELRDWYNSGPELQIDQLVRLSKRVNEVLADKDVAGVVITHGSDPLEQASYFLDLTVTSQKPVVCVASLRSADSRDADGPRNLLDGVRVAISPEASGKGVLVVMNGQIHAARDVSKFHTHSVDTYRSLEFGPIGIADIEKVKFHRAPLRRQTIPLAPDVKLGRVEIVFQYVGVDDRVVRFLLNQGNLDGLVLAGSGIGNFSRANGFAEAIEEVRAKGIPVVLCSRVPTGRVIPLYGGKGRGVHAKQIGCVLDDNLGPLKARILLMLAMTKTKDPNELQKYFDR